MELAAKKRPLMVSETHLPLPLLNRGKVRDIYAYPLTFQPLAHCNGCSTPTEWVKDLVAQGELGVVGVPLFPLALFRQFCTQLGHGFYFGAPGVRMSTSAMRSIRSRAPPALKFMP